MLTLELNGQRYNKTEHANALMKLLNDRNRAAIEFKHANVSAVMVAFGYPYIDGYKPRGNYQAMLVDAIEAQLTTNDRSEEHTSELQSLMRISYAVFCLKKKIQQNSQH